MRRNSIFVVTLTVLSTVVPAAHAGERCSEPYAPTIKLSPTATKQEISTLRTDAEAFLAASDLYQKCMAARGGSELQIHANQVLKQKIGVEFNTVLHAFLASHPGA
jgi:hypothetical protein